MNRRRPLLAESQLEAAGAYGIGVCTRNNATTPGPCGVHVSVEGTVSFSVGVDVDGLVGQATQEWAIGDLRSIGRVGAAHGVVVVACVIKIYIVLPLLGQRAWRVGVDGQWAMGDG